MASAICHIFNPQHMPKGYSSLYVCVCVCVCVCLSVTLLAASYLIYTLKTRVPLSLWPSQDMYYVDFVEIALFKSFGDIC